MPAARAEPPEVTAVLSRPDETQTTAGCFRGGRAVLARAGVTGAVLLTESHPAGGSQRFDPRRDQA